MIRDVMRVPVTIGLLLLCVWVIAGSAANADPSPSPRVISSPMVMATAQPKSDIARYEQIAAAPLLTFDGTAWSVFNHRGSGLFIFLWGLTALIVALQWPGSPWLRFASPLFLVALVEFLLLRNDPKVWPLGPIPFWISFRSPEVFQHRVFILLILAIGIVELLRAADRLPPVAYKYAIPALGVVGALLILFHQHGPEMQQAMQQMSASMTATSPDPNSMNASMALIKREHMWFAILGFGFATSKLLADTGRPPLRLWAVLWPVFTVALGLLLMGYSE